MENAVDALKMAGAVLIFVLALSVIIFYFGQAREVSDTILSYRDRETMYIDGDLYYETSGTERTVSLETIIPSIFRAYLENYRIVFEFQDGPYNKPLYKIKRANGDEVSKYSLDLETNQNTEFQNVVLADNNEKIEFLCGILYRDFRGSTELKFNKRYGITLGDISLYDQLSNARTITEYLGVYYQDDNSNIPDIMKTEKRIITYKVTY